MLTEKIKNNTLKDLATLIRKNTRRIILQNERDMAGAADMDATLSDRLKVDEKKVARMASAVEEVIAMPDPERKILYRYRHPNGMLAENRTVPFGRILIIYESRPDVTIEAAVVAFKAGNKIILKGGREARNTNLYLSELWQQALTMNAVAPDYVVCLDIGREEMKKMLKANSCRADVIIPRGGDGLINYIKKHASVPMIVSGRGNNFVYVHADADFDMAERIVINGKSRLSVCNATDKVLFHKLVPGLKNKIESLAGKLAENHIEVFGDGKFLGSLNGITRMPRKTMYREEFLAPKILFGLVEDMEEAIIKINAYSGGHSAAIVSSDASAAFQFMHETDCAAVYHNASTRFTDGGQMGLGAEIAISTQKLHFRGPVGPDQLVTNKWFITGSGQIRK